MTGNLYSDLAWLPKAPEDFGARCRSLPEDCGPSSETKDALGDRIRALASFALNEIQLGRLAKQIERARVEGRSLAPLIPFRLGIISNATSHFIVPVVVATAARHGIALECIEADYGQVMQSALSAQSAINRARPDAVLVALDYRGVPLMASPGDAATAAQTVESCLGYIETIRAGIKANSSAACILQTLPRPVETQFGGYDFVLPGTEQRIIEQVNRGLGDAIAETGDMLFDVAGLAETVGLVDWHDPMLWNTAKLPFANAFLPLYAEHFCRLIAALKGKSRRCLILDLDNTVWGGVIGDDGLEGIVIGQGDATGEAHLAVQQAALALRGRGVVLAVSSKNTDEIARTPFREHPEMLLREDHIAVFQANWNDKATNIKAIAEELSLGLDAMVFLDDNPAERGLVRRILPQVAVPELPADPSLYARTLLAAGYFEAVAFSKEDRERAAFYQDNARRVALQKQAGDIGAYLESLDMTITFQPFDATGRARIAQLISKSNQFNLTTIRYTEAEVAALERDPNCFTLQVRLSDAFGDNGMISVIVCRAAGETWEIDTWLMSCRVLGRKVESAVLAEILSAARAAGVQRIVGVYRPTPRNALVRDHYSRLGFARTGEEPDGATRWMLDVATEISPAPMKIVRKAGDLVTA